MLQKASYRQEFRRRLGIVAASGAVAVLIAPASVAWAEPAVLGPREAPEYTFAGRVCGEADITQGMGGLNAAGESRVYQLAYYDTDERGMRSATLHVHTNTASWLKQQTGGWEMGPLLGQVVVGCGVR